MVGTARHRGARLPRPPFPPQRSLCAATTSAANSSSRKLHALRALEWGYGRSSWSRETAAAPLSPPLPPPLESLYFPALLNRPSGTPAVAHLQAPDGSWSNEWQWQMVWPRRSGTPPRWAAGCVICADGEMTSASNPHSLSRPLFASAESDSSRDGSLIRRSQAPPSYPTGVVLSVFDPFRPSGTPASRVHPAV